MPTKTVAAIASTLGSARRRSVGRMPPLSSGFADFGAAAVAIAFMASSLAARSSVRSRPAGGGVHGQHQAGFRPMGDQRAGLIPQARFGGGDALAGMDELALAAEHAGLGEDRPHEAHAHVDGGVGLPGFSNQLHR